MREIKQSVLIRKSHCLHHALPVWNDFHRTGVRQSLLQPLRTLAGTHPFLTIQSIADVASDQSDAEAELRDCAGWKLGFHSEHEPCLKKVKSLETVHTSVASERPIAVISEPRV